MDPSRTWLSFPNSRSGSGCFRSKHASTSPGQPSVPQILLKGARVENRPKIPLKSLFMGWLHGSSTRRLLATVIFVFFFLTCTLSCLVALTGCSQTVSWAHLMFLAFRDVAGGEPEWLEQDGPLQCQAVASLFDLVSVLVNASLIGLLATRLVNHNSSLIFSEKLIHTVRGGRHTLKIRVANPHGYAVHSLRWAVRWVHPQQTPEGETYMKLDELPLTGANDFMPLPTALCHVIDVTSPLFEYRHDLGSIPGHISVHVAGHDVTQKCATNGFGVFGGEDIVVDQDFKNVVLIDPFQAARQNSRTVVDFQHFHEVVPAPVPEVQGASTPSTPGKSHVEDPPETRFEIPLAFQREIISPDMQVMFLRLDMALGKLLDSLEDLKADNVVLLSAGGDRCCQQSWIPKLSATSVPRLSRVGTQLMDTRCLQAEVVELHVPVHDAEFFVYL